MNLKDKKVTGSLINFDESNFNDYYKKEDVDEAVAELKDEIHKKSYSSDDGFCDPLIDIYDLMKIIREVFE